MGVVRGPHAVFHHAPEGKPHGAEKLLPPDLGLACASEGAPPAGRLSADFRGLDKGEVFLEGRFAAHLLAGRNAKAALILPGQALRFRAEFGWKPFEGHGLLLPRRRAADEAQMEPGGMASGACLDGARDREDAHVLDEGEPLWPLEGWLASLRKQILQAGVVLPHLDEVGHGQPVPSLP